MPPPSGAASLRPRRRSPSIRRTAAANAAPSIPRGSALSPTTCSSVRPENVHVPRTVADAVATGKPREGCGSVRRSAGGLRHQPGVAKAKVKSTS